MLPMFALPHLLHVGQNGFTSYGKYGRMYVGQFNKTKLLMNAQRQTDYDLDQIENLLANPSSSRVRPCGLLNEVGVIALNENDSESVRAQTLLVEHLRNESEKLRWIAIRCLMTLNAVGKANKEAKEAIVSFTSDAKNKKIIPSDEEMKSIVLKLEITVTA